MTTGKKIGYIRIGTVDVKENKELEELPVDQIFEDNVGAKSSERPQLEAMIAFVHEGDTVVVQSMDRLARNFDDLRRIVSNLTGRGVKVQFLKEDLTFTSEDNPMANLLLSAMGAFAEFEKALIRERQLEGVAIAKKKGLYKGRKPKFTQTQVEEIKARAKNGEKKAALARDFEVSRETIYQVLNKK